MVDLPDMPPAIARLPRDHRGFPVPWFVRWFDGVPHFPTADADKIPIALKQSRCWICGEPMVTRFGTFVIGPMCAVNRVSSEPPSHFACAEFAAKACPFLVRPRMKRFADDDRPEGSFEPDGMIRRNPGVCLLWMTDRVETFRHGNTTLLRIGDPVKTEWYAEGRAATREEILASIEGGLPELWRLAAEQGYDGNLTADIAKAMRLVPPDPNAPTHTKDKLAMELEKAGLSEMADRARRGYYHDFLSPLATPCVQLANDLAAAGTPEARALRARHLRGEFDASKEESDEWAAGPEGQAAMAELMRGKRR